MHSSTYTSSKLARSNHEVTELTWENGQLAIHELGGIFPPPTSASSFQPKATWDGGGRASDTLESIVHQATYCNKQSPHLIPATATQQAAAAAGGQNMENVGSVGASSGGKWAENSGPIHAPSGPPPPLPSPSGLMKKRTRSEPDHCPRNNDQSAGASANAAFCRDTTDTTMMTWASFESPRSFTRTKTTTDEDSACHGGSENQEEEREMKGETGRSYTRKGRAAAVHNQSERRRRDRINQKMKTLQKLVPNASKTDKASMLDEVIEYLKQLQAQIQMMSNARFMPHIMMPLGMQQHLQQMSLLARMGMGAGLGIGMGMLDTAGISSIGHTQPPPQPMAPLIHPTQVATGTSTFVPPAFVVPHIVPAAHQPNPDPGTSSSVSLQDPYSKLLAQSMNIDLYNRIAALQRQQQTPSQPTSNQMQ